MHKTFEVWAMHQKLKEEINENSGKIMRLTLQQQIFTVLLFDFEITGYFYGLCQWNNSSFITIRILWFYFLIEMCSVSVVLKCNWFLWGVICCLRNGLLNFYKIAHGWMRCWERLLCQEVIIGTKIIFHYFSVGSFWV